MQELPGLQARLALRVRVVPPVRLEQQDLLVHLVQRELTLQVRQDPPALLAPQEQGQLGHQAPQDRVDQQEQVVQALPGLLDPLGLPVQVLPGRLALVDRLVLQG